MTGQIGRCIWTARCGLALPRGPSVGASLEETSHCGTSRPNLLNCGVGIAVNPPATFCRLAASFYERDTRGRPLMEAVKPQSAWGKSTGLVVCLHHRRDWWRDGVGRGGRLGTRRVPRRGRRTRGGAVGGDWQKWRSVGCVLVVRIPAEKSAVHLKSTCHLTTCSLPTCRLSICSLPTYSLPSCSLPVVYLLVI